MLDRQVKKINHTKFQVFLFIDPVFFLQLLEGPENAVKELFEVISKDTRHYEIKVLSQGPVEERVFIDWGMNYLVSNGAEGAILSTLLKDAHELGSMALDDSLDIIEQFLNFRTRVRSDT